MKNIKGIFGEGLVLFGLPALQLIGYFLIVYAIFHICDRCL